MRRRRAKPQTWRGASRMDTPWLEHPARAFLCAVKGARSLRSAACAEPFDAKQARARCRGRSCPAQLAPMPRPLRQEARPAWARGSRADRGPISSTADGVRHPPYSTYLKIAHAPAAWPGAQVFKACKSGVDARRSPAACRYRPCPALEECRDKSRGAALADPSLGKRRRMERAGRCHAADKAVIAGRRDLHRHVLNCTCARRCKTAQLAARLCISGMQYCRQSWTARASADLLID